MAGGANERDLKRKRGQIYFAALKVFFWLVCNKLSSFSSPFPCVSSLRLMTTQTSAARATTQIPTQLSEASALQHFNAQPIVSLSPRWRFGFGDSVE
jgi:hypothetical protein